MILKCPLNNFFWMTPYYVIGRGMENGSRKEGEEKCGKRESIGNRRVKRKKKGRRTGRKKRMPKEGE